MPYQSLLDSLVRSVAGATGALLLDSEGEPVVESGARDHRHRLIGAYQGIALAKLRRIGERFETGALRFLLCRYVEGTVVLRPLKDGYYLVLSLADGGNLGQGLRRSEQTQALLDAEL
jgi:predicted regulator of Ras-like GTPase activity (Roadblock/LC7/MglB family)